MFEAAELGRRISKDEYRTIEPALRADLLAEQVRLRDAPFPVVLVFAGVGGAGKGETVNLLNEWMDPRWLVTRAFGDPSDEERERPEYWRYWLNLPPRGRIGLYMSSWYSQPVLDRVYRRTDLAAYAEQLTRVVEFERTLAEAGTLILKFWMHLDKGRQEKRLTRLERDPLTRWRVTKLEWKHWRMYDRFIDAAERAIRHTSRAHAPWIIVEGADANYRSVAVGTAIRDAIRQRLEQREATIATVATGVSSARTRGAHAVKRKKTALPATTTILGHLDTSLRIEKKQAARKIELWQGRLNQLQQKAAARGISTVMVFEGWDAAGKGGAIRRITGALDARQYQVIPIAAPTDEERAHHYLWRFWRHLSRAGRVTIFDRSWYGRVLVERVEGFATEQEWMRAYGEINQFEDQLVAGRTIVLKFWLHITPEEQLRRFEDRQARAWKRWKITDEDWRNREKWPAYDVAVNDMIERTSTRAAPWTLVEANDKAFARVKVLRTACERLAEALAGA
ncbi:MAG: polyphosphate:AMP phosphotransferase [Acidobacteria bacterium]|jgi:polyphosphate:AMP phosphotransferase|nr:polyphosphate:AMP phosphotransferase [Acidobacteriota bacterium]